MYLPEKKSRASTHLINPKTREIGVRNHLQNFQRSASSQLLRKPFKPIKADI